MRTYIFTVKERRIVEAWLKGESVPAIKIAKLRWMVRHYERLREDVELYLRFRKAVTAKSA